LASELLIAILLIVSGWGNRWVKTVIPEKKREKCKAVVVFEE
jgi:hypothetical protein